MLFYLYGSDVSPFIFSYEVNPHVGFAFWVKGVAVVFPHPYVLEGNEAFGRVEVKLCRFFKGSSQVFFSAFGILILFAYLCY